MPLEQEQKEFYQGFLFNKPNTKDIKKTVQRKKTDLLNFLKNTPLNGMTFLDYGGGTGMAALAASELGLETFLYEIDEEAVEFLSALKQNKPIGIYSDLSQFKEKKFDVILCDNVIEHVDAPKELMKRLYSLLQPNGVLIFKTPNMRNIRMWLYPHLSLLHYIRKTMVYNNLSVAVRALLFRPWCLDPPRHLFSFSKQSLHVLGKATSSTEIEIGNCPNNSLFLASIYNGLKNARTTVFNKIALGFILLTLLPLLFLLQIADWIIQNLSAFEIYMKIKKPKSLENVTSSL